MTVAERYSENRNEALKSTATYNIVLDNDYPPQRRHLLNALDYLKSNLKYIDEDMNNYDAIKPSQNAITMTEHFISHLSLNKKHADYIEPNGDGGIILKWQINEGEVLLTIDGIALHLSSDAHGDGLVFIDDVNFFDTRDTFLPQKILKYIPAKRSDSRNHYRG